MGPGALLRLRASVFPVELTVTPAEAVVDLMDWKSADAQQRAEGVMRWYSYP